MTLELYRCEHCGKLFDKPLTITYSDRKVCLCPLCGEETRGITVMVEVEVEQRVKCFERKSESTRVQPQHL